jgi:hypothetical protein
MTRDAPAAFMASLSNHEGLAGLAVRRFMVRQAHHEAFDARREAIPASSVRP